MTFSPDSFDFSGNYAFVTTAAFMHRLDESVRPLLEDRGGRIVRIYVDNANGRLTSGFAADALPADFFARQAVRAVFTQDFTAPPELVPPHIPLIALPHAFWTDPAGQMESLRESPFYLGNADYYLAQDRACAVDWEVASLRRRDCVRALPLGSLKLDELRRRWLAEANKQCLLYCCGSLSEAASPLEERMSYVEACLRRFPDRILYVRPFPGERGRYDALARHFRSAGNFRIDGNRSLLRHLPSAAALICDDSSTVGMMYSLATGRRAVYLPAHSSYGQGVRQTRFSAVHSPEEMVRELEQCLAGSGDEEPELLRLRERLVFRPGHARELFYSYVSRILSGAELPEALAVPCEYVGNLHFATPRDAIAFFVRALRDCRVESYQTVLGLRSGAGMRLAVLYTQLRQRLRHGAPVVLLVRGSTCRVPEGGEDVSCPVYYPSPPAEYRPATRDFLRERHASARDFPPAGEEEACIVLPDRDKRTFCLALAVLVERMFGMV